MSDDNVISFRQKKNDRNPDDSHCTHEGKLIAGDGYIACKTCGSVLEEKEIIASFSRYINWEGNLDTDLGRKYREYEQLDIDIKRLKRAKQAGSHQLRGIDHEITLRERVLKGLNDEIRSLTPSLEQLKLDLQMEK